VERIKTSRPSLRHTSPIVFWLSCGFVGINTLLAISFWTTPPARIPLIIVHSPFTLVFWGFVFLFLAITGLASLIWDRWRYIRTVLMMGLFVKSLWFYALAINIPKQGIAGVGVWGMIAYAQLLAVIYFPRSKKERQNG
jgi:hypothetical protein